MMLIWSKYCSGANKKCLKKISILIVADETTNVKRLSLP